MFTDFAQNMAAFASKFPFDNLVWLAWGSFAAIYVIVLTLVFALPNVRAASKKPFLCLVYCYTVITFEVFLTANTFEQSLFVAGIFWLAGYLCYGLLCAVSREKKSRVPAQIAATAAPVIIASPPAQTELRQIKPAQKQSSPSAPARNNVRLEHALNVTVKLLEKNLSKTDRQELEKLKNTLEVLKVKGTLTAAEGEILNESFNALLKLMAKYNV